MWSVSRMITGREPGRDPLRGFCGLLHGSRSSDDPRRTSRLCYASPSWGGWRRPMPTKISPTIFSSAASLSSTVSSSAIASESYGDSLRASTLLSIISIGGFINRRFRPGPPLSSRENAGVAGNEGSRVRQKGRELEPRGSGLAFCARGDQDVNTIRQNTAREPPGPGAEAGRNGRFAGWRRGGADPGPWIASEPGPRDRSWGAHEVTRSEGAAATSSISIVP
jgi:hypothetical protein